MKQKRKTQDLQEVGQSAKRRVQDDTQSEKRINLPQFKTFLKSFGSENHKFDEETLVQLFMIQNPPNLHRALQIGEMLSQNDEWVLTKSRKDISQLEMIYNVCQIHLNLNQTQEGIALKSFQPFFILVNHFFTMKAGSKLDVDAVLYSYKLSQIFLLLTGLIYINKLQNAQQGSQKMVPENRNKGGKNALKQSKDNIDLNNNQSSGNLNLQNYIQDLYTRSLHTHVQHNRQILEKNDPVPYQNIEDFLNQERQIYNLERFIFWASGAQYLAYQQDREYVQALMLSILKQDYQQNNSQSGSHSGECSQIKLDVEPNIQNQNLDDNLCSQSSQTKNNWISRLNRNLDIASQDIRNTNTDIQYNGSSNNQNNDDDDGYINRDNKQASENYSSDDSEDIKLKDIKSIEQGKHQTIEDIQVKLKINLTEALKLENLVKTLSNPFEINAALTETEEGFSYVMMELLDFSSFSFMSQIILESIGLMDHDSSQIKDYDSVKSQVDGRIQDNVYLQSAMVIAIRICINKQQNLTSSSKSFLQFLVAIKVIQSLGKYIEVQLLLQDLLKIYKVQVPKDLKDHIQSLPQNSSSFSIQQILQSSNDQIIQFILIKQNLQSIIDLHNSLNQHKDPIESYQLNQLTQQQQGTFYLDNRPDAKADAFSKQLNMKGIQDIEDQVSDMVGQVDLEDGKTYDTDDDENLQNSILQQLRVNKRIENQADSSSDSNI